MLIERFMRWWSCENFGEDSPAPHVIIPLSYGSKRDKLALATEYALLEAIGFAIEEFPDAYLAYGNDNICFPNAAKIDEAFKIEILRKNFIPEERAICAGPIENSITEAFAIRKALEARHAITDVLLLVSTHLHSRSLRHIYRQVFPHAQILITCLPGTPDVEPDHRIWLQRYRFIWVLANIARQMVMRVTGLEFAKRITHPTAK